MGVMVERSMCSNATSTRAAKLGMNLQSSTLTRASLCQGIGLMPSSTHSTRSANAVPSCAGVNTQCP